jgi:hypothetical protein
MINRRVHVVTNINQFVPQVYCDYSSRISIVTSNLSKGDRN